MRRDLHANEREREVGFNGLWGYPVPPWLGRRRYATGREVKVSHKQ